jgi:PAS domain S-box-containing protein
MILGSRGIDVRLRLVAPVLRRTRARREFERYFTLSAEMIILGGFDGYWKRVNSSVEAILGYSEREALARPFIEFVHPDDRERTEVEAGRVVAVGTARTFEIRMVCRNGSAKWIEWSVTPVPNERVMYCVGRDVSERRRSVSEQTALRRVATLVAQEAPQSEMFRAIAEEIARLLGTEEIRMVRFDGGNSAVVVGSSGDGATFPLGSRQQLEGDTVAPRVLRTGRTARIDGYAKAGGRLAETARSLGILSVVGAPILVEGRLWGAIITGSTTGASLPPDTESRLVHFTELMATAIANAQARETLQRLADEQAALRRVATLVASGASPDEVFTAVAKESGRLLAGDYTALSRYDGDESATVVGAWSGTEAEPPAPIGSRFPVSGHDLTTLVFQSQRPARLDEYEKASGPSADVVKQVGVRSAVGVPITVEGRLWGALILASVRDEPLPADTETRLADFAELLATAVANTQARETLQRLVDEQAALRRVATLVAQGVPPAELFSAVTKEVAYVFSNAEPPLVATIIKFDPGPESVLVGASRPYESEPIGSRWAPKDLYVSTRVLRTERSARVGEIDLESLGGPDAEVLRLRRFLNQVGSPIVVEGRLWGAMTLNCNEVLPPDTDERLANFTELVATAIANAESREALAQLADEQAALRRIATLVAKGVRPEQVFAAVTEEVAATFRAFATVIRFDHDPLGIVYVGVSKEIEIPIGTSWNVDDALAAAKVYRTGCSARVDAAERSSARGAITEAARRLGIETTVASPIIVEGGLWGVISVSARDELPSDTEQRLEKFTELVTTAIANAEGKSELAASRRRIVAASDESRRQIERNLHDGTQQRLVTLGLAVRAAEANLPGERDDLRAQLSGVATGLVGVLEDLQEISRGIHPAILSMGGLGPALQTLARRSMIPVNLRITTDVRMAEPIEVAAYYVASEALANAAKHSEASRIDVSLEERDQCLLLSVRDDGVGGADIARGSGLVGLTDRVEALGGSICVDSRAGEGTLITAELPMELESP